MPFAPGTGRSVFLEKFGAVAKGGRVGDAEGNNGLAGEILRFNKRTDWPGGDAPPDRVADQDSIIIGPIGDVGGGELHIALGFIGIF